MDHAQYIRIQQLIAARQAGVSNASEDAELDAWLAADPDNRRLYDQLDDPAQLASLYADYLSVREAMRIRLETALPELKETGKAPHSRVQRLSFLHRWRGVAAAAIMLLVLGGGAYFWLQQNRLQPLAIRNDRLSTDIEPGRNGAVLTLADGSRVVLDSLGNGVIATQNGSRVMLKDGRLAYDPAGKTATTIAYNTMTVPKGRQFSLQLPDGTKVWLNSASSLRYPTVFSGAERRVEITGEAYFEVARNTRQPFRVRVNNKAEVEVLGTSFNVNAYEDENTISTTLLEGAVKVIQVLPSGRPEHAANVILQPGQQAQLPVTTMSVARKPASPVINVINNANIDKVMAWKNGAFNFQDASLEEVMRQLARWYDIEVVYEQGIPDIHFVGEMSRDQKLSGVLRSLEKLKIHFRLEGERKLVVMP